MHCSSADPVTDARRHPDRPYLAVSAAVFRNDRVLIVRRARAPAQGLYTLPGGVVEIGESLRAAVVREVREETAIAIDPVALVGEREIIVHDSNGKVERHFVILSFAARWIAGEVVLNDELEEAQWMRPSDVESLPTTKGLTGIIAAAQARIEDQGC
jgi:8-oxo-dGTP diphosphatase